MVFEGTTGREKELYENSKWISRSLFCLRSNLSNNDIISEYINMHMYAAFCASSRSEIRWEKMTFLVWHSVTPPKIPRGIPPRFKSKLASFQGGPQTYVGFHGKFLKFNLMELQKSKLRKFKRQHYDFSPERYNYNIKKLLKMITGCLPRQTTWRLPIRS